MSFFGFYILFLAVWLVIRTDSFVCRAVICDLSQAYTFGECDQQGFCYLINNLSCKGSVSLLSPFLC